jgi:hypothetical protein
LNHKSLIQLMKERLKNSKRNVQYLLDSALLWWSKYWIKINIMLTFSISMVAYWSVSNIIGVNIVVKVIKCKKTSRFLTDKLGLVWFLKITDMGFNYFSTFFWAMEFISIYAQIYNTWFLEFAFWSSHTPNKTVFWKNDEMALDLYSLLGCA